MMSGTEPVRKLVVVRGTTEEYIGNWLHKNPDLRDKVQTSEGS